MALLLITRTMLKLLITGNGQMSTMLLHYPQGTTRINFNWFIGKERVLIR